MRKIISADIEHGRALDGPYRTTWREGTIGIFILPSPFDPKRNLKIMVSDGRDWSESLPGEPWEHVSVSISLTTDTPTWEEMDYVKRLFWSDDEVVVQFHVNDGRKINRHSGVLHLWKPPYQIILPPQECV